MPLKSPKRLTSITSTRGINGIWYNQKSWSPVISLKPSPQNQTKVSSEIRCPGATRHSSPAYSPAILPHHPLSHVKTIKPAHPLFIIYKTLPIEPKGHAGVFGDTARFLPVIMPATRGASEDVPFPCDGIIVQDIWNDTCPDNVSIRCKTMEKPKRTPRSEIKTSWSPCAHLRKCTHAAAP